MVGRRPVVRRPEHGGDGEQATAGLLHVEEGRAAAVGAGVSLFLADAEAGVILELEPAVHQLAKRGRRLVVGVGRERLAHPLDGVVGVVDDGHGDGVFFVMFLTVFTVLLLLTLGLLLCSRLD